MCRKNGRLRARQRGLTEKKRGRMGEKQMSDEKQNKNKKLQCESETKHKRMTAKRIIVIR